MEGEDRKDQLDAVKSAWEMGVTLKEDEVRGLTGMSKPGPADAVLQGKQQTPPGLGLPGMNGAPPFGGNGAADGNGEANGNGEGGGEGNGFPGRFQRAEVPARHVTDASGHEHKPAGEGGGQFTSGGGGGGGGKAKGHGYTSAELDAMTPAQRRSLAGLGLGVSVRGLSDEEIRQRLEPEGRAAMAGAAGAATGRQQALAELMTARAAGQKAGGADPRGDLSRLPSGPRLPALESAVARAVGEHGATRGGVGMPADQLYQALGGEGSLRPEEFRALLLHGRQQGSLLLGGWPRMPEDLPRPDLAPLAGDTILWNVRLRQPG